MEEEIKKGARNNRMDQASLNAAHDALVAAGADCPGMDMEKSIDSDDTVVYFGNTVKAVKLDDGSVKLGAYLITFGDDKNTDLTGDFFAPDTDYGEATESDVYFNHRLPVEADGVEIEYKARLSRARLQKDDVGIFAETILKARNQYEQAIIDAGLAGQLGWSSGTAGHLVEREQVGKAWKITAWPIGLDASLTPRPAEPRLKNMVVPLKSISVNSQVETERAAQDKREATDKPDTNQSLDGGNTKGVQMELTKEELQEMLTQASADGAKKAIAETEPVKTAGVHIQVTEAAEDRPFKSIAENLQAIKANTVSYGNADNEYPRLRYLKATGASEGVPADGGVLLDPTVAPEIIKPIHETGPFSSAINWLPVGNNSNYGWVNGVDETSRVAGSRWGGIRGYRLNEGGTKTASKPAFRRIQWELKKYAAVVVATDELLADASQFSAIVRQGVSEELNFMLNEDIYDGVGLAGPQGIQNSGAMITVTRTDANKILGDDITNMYYRMSLRGRNSANWYVGNDSLPQLDKLFASGSTAVLFPFATLGADGIRRLYNRPVITTEFNESLGTAGDIIFADMNQYLGWEKGGVEESTSIHVYYLTDETAFRFVYRCDGKPAVNTALTPLKGSTTTSPFVRLLATS